MIAILITSFLLGSKPTKLTFVAREGARIFYTQIQNGKISTTITTCPILQNVKSGVTTKLFISSLADTQSGSKISVSFKDGSLDTIHRPKIAAGHREYIDADQSAKYLFYLTCDANLKYQSTIYEVANRKCRLVCVVPGRALGVTDSMVVSAVTGSELRFTNVFGAKTLNQSLVKALNSVYASRSNNWISNPNRQACGDRQYTGGPISPVVKCALMFLQFGVSIAFMVSDRVPNAEAKSWATRLLKSRVAKIEVKGFGLSRGKESRTSKKVTIKNKTEIVMVLQAFQKSTRMSKFSEAGANIEISDEFKVFEYDSKGKLKETNIFVVAPDIDLFWGSPVKKMYEFLRKKAKPLRPPLS